MLPEEQRQEHDQAGEGEESQQQQEAALDVLDPAPARCGGSGELEEGIGEGETIQTLCPGCEDCDDDLLELEEIAPVSTA